MRPTVVKNWLICAKNVFVKEKEKLSFSICHATQKLYYYYLGYQSCSEPCLMQWLQGVRCIKWRCFPLCDFSSIWSLHWLVYRGLHSRARFDIWIVFLFYPLALSKQHTPPPLWWKSFSWVLKRGLILFFK